jgi:hypothetical protein
MHTTVSLVAQAVTVAQRLGYEVRQEWLGGKGGGRCELRGRKLLFLDLAQGPAEQLEGLLGTLRLEPGALGVPMPHSLSVLLRPAPEA